MKQQVAWRSRVEVCLSPIPCCPYTGRGARAACIRCVRHTCLPTIQMRWLRAPNQTSYAYRINALSRGLGHRRRWPPARTSTLAADDRTWLTIPRVDKKPELCGSRSLRNRSSGSMTFYAGLVRNWNWPRNLYGNYARICTLPAG